MKNLYGLLLVFLLLLSMVSSGCSGIGVLVSDIVPGYEDVSVDEAKDLIDSGTVFVLDVRTAQEYSSGHVGDAVNINVEELGERLDEVPDDMDILVYCRSGVRSARASGILVDAGYSQVYNMEGGISEWIASGYPTVTDISMD